MAPNLKQLSLLPTTLSSHPQAKSAPLNTQTATDDVQQHVAVDNSDQSNSHPECDDCTKEDLFSALHIQENLVRAQQQAKEVVVVRVDKKTSAENDDYWAENCAVTLPQHDSYWMWKEESAESESDLYWDRNGCTDVDYKTHRTSKASSASQTTPSNDEYWACLWSFL